MEIDKPKYEAVMAKYAQLTGPGLELKTAQAFTDEVKKAVAASQKHADAVVNLISARKRTDEKAGVTVGNDGVRAAVLEEVPPDYEAAKEALTNLAKSVGPIVDHWRPFVELACDALGVDVSKVLPRNMVPDVGAMEAALQEQSEYLDRAREKVSALESQLADATAANKALQAARDELSKQLDSVAASLESHQKAVETEKKRAADLAAENEALKGQLAAHSKEAGSTGGKKK